jgi:hypothetical protein
MTKQKQMPAKLVVVFLILLAGNSLGQVSNGTDAGGMRRRQANQPGAAKETRAHTRQTRLLGANIPHGISVVNAVNAERVGKLFDMSDPTLNAYANPNTAGVTFRTSWADVEPEEGKFDFSKLDTVFSNAEKNGKWVNLILIPGFGTPGWAMKGAQSGTFTIQYGRGNGKSLPLPLPWDQTYLSRWFTFLKVIASRYGDKTSFRMIAAAGPTSVSSEMSLPESREEISQWKKFGYSSERYVAAWKQTFSAYSATFPHQYFSLALHPALPIPDAHQKASVRAQIINLGLQYPTQFALESDGLNSSRTDRTLELVRDHSGQVVTGFMMSTAATDKPQRMGGTDDPALALKKAIDVGVEPNRAGKRVNFLQIYEPDVLSKDMQSVLSYGAALLPGK